MSVNYASKYSSQVDERFNLGSLTGGAVNNNYDFIGTETVKVYSIPTVGMNDYKTNGSNRYGQPDELGNEVQEMTLSRDRSFTFTIDRKSYDDTQMTMEAGKHLHVRSQRLLSRKWIFTVFTRWLHLQRQKTL